MVTDGYLTYGDDFVMDLNSKSLYCTLETCGTSLITLYTWASQVALVLKNPTANAGSIRDVGLIPGSEDPLEEGMENHSSILAWRIPWTEEPGGL